MSRRAPLAKGVTACSISLLLTFSAFAQPVALVGMMGSKALLVVGAASPKTVGAGETHEGVKVISTSTDQAVVEQAGRRITLRVGESPVSINRGGAVANGGGTATGKRIVLSAGPGGHFVTAGQINSRAVQFMVDTGATAIALSFQDAERAGIAYKSGQPVTISTANGQAQGYVVKLNSVRIGDVEVFEVEAVVIAQPMPYLLLGNSFLNRFRMERDNDQMVLTKKF